MGEGGGGGYGGGGEDEDASPPPSGDARELTSVEEFDLFLDDNDASVIGAFLTKEMPDPSGVKPEGWDDDEDGEWSPETITNPALTAFNAITGETYGYRRASTSTARPASCPRSTATARASASRRARCRSPPCPTGWRPRRRRSSASSAATPRSVTSTARCA